MSVSLHIRDVPETLHETLVQRARDQQVSLRSYLLQVLEQHCTLPTWNEWLAELSTLPAIGPGISGAEAVRQAREEDEEDLAAVLAGR